MGPLCRKKRVQNSVQREASIVPRPSLLPAASKSAAGRRSRQSPLKRGSGRDNPGMSRILLSNFPHSQEELETPVDHRPLCSQSFCRLSELQNGDAEKSEKCHSSQRLGIFVGPDGRLFACSDSSFVTQIPQVHVERPSIPVQSARFRSLDQPSRVYSPDVRHSDVSKGKGNNSPSLPRRLVSSKPKSSSSVGTQTISIVPDQFSGSDYQLRETDLVPAQVFTFIGMEFLTQTNIVRVPQDRVLKILETVRQFSQKYSVSARDFLSLLGQLGAAADFVMLGRLHLRPLQMSLLNQWRPHKFPLNHQIDVTTEILHHLKWWQREDLFLQGVPLKIDPPSHFIFTDASHSGWGGHVEPEGLLFHGVWTESQSRLHINILEMKAISLSLTQALHTVRNTTVMVSTDNTTVVAYLRHQGGTHSPDLCLEAWGILNMCLKHNIQLLIKHIPGRFNTLADRMSRMDKPITTEWSLDQGIANRVFMIMGYPSIDLFATRLNNRLPLYVSPIPDQQALSIDALSMDWNRIHAYAFPPFHLIPAVINKVQSSQCKIILIAPLWPDRPWFPELLRLLVSPPVYLPEIPKLLTQLKGKIIHQNPGPLQLHAWELSNNHSEIDNFRVRLQTMSPRLGESRPLRFMMRNGRSSVVGLINGRPILSRPLPK